jgi:hypothetical protein
MANFNSGIVNVGTPGSQTALSLAKGSRRLYDFSDRVAELAPEESPFFVYLSKVGKVPTSDPQFRFLEDRSTMQWTDRSFTTSTNLDAVVVGAVVSATLSSAQSWLIKGMVIQVSSIQGESNAPNHATAVITAINSSTSIDFKWLTNPGSDADPAAFVNAASIAGHIIANGQAQTAADGTQIAYTEGAAYLKTVAAGSLTYDVLLRDLEVVFDPARGGSSAKLALCSLPVISLFNKLGDGVGFIGDSLSATVPYNFERSKGSFGHKIMKIETVHGDLSLVREPLFRGMAAEFCCMVDLDHVSYRPLVGNGVNRDTSIETNVQAADEDLRKDLILTEAGLEVSLPESHALFVFEEAIA